MRIDPKETIAGYPAVLVRDTLRRLRARVDWSLDRLEVAARLPTGQGRNFVEALVGEGLAKPAGDGVWSITQAGQTLSSATAAKRVKRATAETALHETLGRIDFVNKRRYYLGRVTSVVIFGSMLKPEIDWVSDIDLAVEIAPREPDKEKFRAKVCRRAAEFDDRGQRFHGLLGRELCWYWEVFDFLKEGSRIISLVDVKSEGEFVLRVPHKTLYADGRWHSDAPPRAPFTHRYCGPPDDNGWF
jgi:predicted nucleotidyltransferase